MRQNQGKKECSIQAVQKVVPAPVRFWECGARFFLEKFTLLGLDEAAAVFGRKDGLGLNLQERDTRIVYAVRVVANRFFPAAAGSKCHAVEGGLTLSDVRGERLSGNVVERRA